MQELLKSKPAKILSVALLAQAAIYYGFTRNEVVPETRPLAEVPAQIGPWSMQSEGVVEKEIADFLKADELLTRSYVSPASGPVPAYLFVAYFSSQRTGRTPHSPKNCLPGSGWSSTVSDTIKIDVPNRGVIEPNRYIVQKGDAKSLVVYWYQSRDRVTAAEYAAKFYVVADALRYNRTDTALVRVIVPIVNNDEASAEKVATEFVKSLYSPLRQHFPA